MARRAVERVVADDRGERLVSRARRSWFEALLSADAARAYKPHPAVYQPTVDRFGWAPDRIGFVTANGWHAAGAAAHGFAVAWLRPPAPSSRPSRRLYPGEAPWATVPGQFASG